MIKYFYKVIQTNFVDDSETGISKNNERKDEINKNKDINDDVNKPFINIKENVLLQDKVIKNNLDNSNVLTNEMNDFLNLNLKCTNQQNNNDNNVQFKIKNIDQETCKNHNKSSYYSFIKEEPLQMIKDTLEYIKEAVKRLDDDIQILQDDERQYEVVESLKEDSHIVSIFCDDLKELIDSVPELKSKTQNLLVNLLLISTNLCEDADSFEDKFYSFDECKQKLNSDTSEFTEYLQALTNIVFPFISSFTQMTCCDKKLSMESVNESDQSNDQVNISCTKNHNQKSYIEPDLFSGEQNAESSDIQLFIDFSSFDNIKPIILDFNYEQDKEDEILWLFENCYEKNITSNDFDINKSNIQISDRQFYLYSKMLTVLEKYKNDGIFCYCYFELSLRIKNLIKYKVESEIE